MAQSFTNEHGTFYVPGSTVSTKVQGATGGLAATGIILLIGEATSGPSFAEEVALNDNAFGPDQETEVVAKYGSGPIVDAFKAAVNASGDTEIPGSPNRIIIAKTNRSTKAVSDLLNHSGGLYATLSDRNRGRTGNLIYRSVAETAEVLPTTGPITWIPPVGTVSYSMVASGGAAVGGMLAAGTDPEEAADAFDDLVGISATGGAAKNVSPATGTLAVSIPTAGTIQVVASGSWANAPIVGGTLVIASDTALTGAGNANVGAYVITAATSSTLTATKKSDVGKVGAVAGTITPPVAVASTPTEATALKVYAPIMVSLSAGNPLPGVGKSLEIAETLTGSDLLTRCMLVGTNSYSKISTAATPNVITSGAESRVALKVARNADNISEDLVAGGEVALRIGYVGTSASITLNDKNLTASVTGGSGAGFTIQLSDFPTVSDLATYIGSRTGFTASPGNASLGQLPSTALDNGIYDCITVNGALTARIKTDAYRFANVVNGQSILVQLTNQSSAGLPVAAPVAYLDGGTVGGTTNEDINTVLLASEKVKTNFLVSCFSRDAELDKADGFTDSSSTYTLETINAAVKSHVLKTGTIKQRKSRLGLVSVRGTFDEAKEVAGNQANPSMVVFFHDVKDLNAAGNLVQMPPYIAAAKAAGMQAAAGPKAVFNKIINCSGALQAAGDWSDQSVTEKEDAIKAGLMAIIKSDSGGFRFLSDQTSYLKDNNFVYNSMQAMYAANVVAETFAMRMENAFVGQSLADISAPVALSYLESIAEDLVSTKWLASSDDAPTGYRKPRIRINGPVMAVSIEVKLATANYFIPINLLISQVTQSAGE